MIKKHEFNSLWWGTPVGIVTDQYFFQTERSVQKEKLSQFDWVEYKQAPNGGIDRRCLSESCFFHIDTQVNFRISLKKIVAGPSMDALGVAFADEDECQVGLAEMAAFKHERFNCIPGITQQKVNERYVLWANEIMRENPQWCVRIDSDGEAQGWFLSVLEGNTLNLALAMQSINARVSGMYLFQKALLAYAERGARLCKASFSVSNTSVHNIYSQLNAQFVEPLECWLWLNDRI